MTDTQAAAMAAPAARTGGSGRTMILAGCTVGGTLCASLSSSSQVNVLFAIGSAVFAGLIVFFTAVPAVAAAPAAVAPATPGGPAIPVPTAAVPAGGNSWMFGIAAAALSFILNQLVQFAIGLGVAFNLGPDATSETFFNVMLLFGTSIVIIRFPFDLMIGSYLLTRARQTHIALLAFGLAYAFAYVVEQFASASMGVSGFAAVFEGLGAGAALQSVAIVLGLPILGAAIGAYGTVLAGYFTRRKR